MSTGKIHHRGLWQIPYKATDVLTSDGKRRSARITGDADTFYTIPASVQVQGKTVTGFLMSIHTDEGAPDLEFIANRDGKNYNLLPNK